MSLFYMRCEKILLHQEFALFHEIECKKIQHLYGKACPLFLWLCTQAMHKPLQFPRPAKENRIDFVLY